LNSWRISIASLIIRAWQWDRPALMERALEEAWNPGEDVCAFRISPSPACLRERGTRREKGTIVAAGDARNSQSKAPGSFRSGRSFNSDISQLAHFVQKVKRRRRCVPCRYFEEFGEPLGLLREGWAFSALLWGPDLPGGS
jgi:hypothetical protein